MQWAQQFREVVFLDGNDYHRRYTSYDAVLAVDAFTSSKTDYTNAFAELNEYQQVTKDWLFGYLSYDLKKTTPRKLTSDNFDGLHFPDLFFFQPKKVFLIRGDVVELQFLNMCEEESPLTPEGKLKPEGGCNDNALWNIFTGNELETRNPQPPTHKPANY